MKSISKNKMFEIDTSGRKNSLKIIHINTNECRTVHPGEKAVEPLKKWFRKFNITL